jgi:SAM-dependent methyltransferase
MIKALIFFTLLAILLILWKRMSHGAPREGFEQMAPFTLKRNDSIYDNFYATIYDDIHNTGPRTETEISEIVKIVQPSNNSIFLDIGSGTGHLVNTLTQMGFNAHGIDKSKAMVSKSTENFPEAEFKCGDVSDSMSFDRGTFTHITCMNFTIYHLQDKMAFFKNCYYWLSPNGYLIVHLVDRDKYNAVAPVANPTFVDNPQKYTEGRIIESNAKLNDFKYSNAIDLKTKGTVIVKERFTDIATNNTRENELTLYMEDRGKILDIAQKCGFIPHAQINANGDEHQFIYIFERML